MTRPFKRVEFPTRRNKYGAKRTNGYDSKREAEYASELQRQKQAGVVVDWLEQVPIKLPGCKYVVDFLVFYEDGSVRMVEVKGRMTPAASLKLRALEECRPELFAILDVVK